MWLLKKTCKSFSKKTCGIIRSFVWNTFLSFFNIFNFNKWKMNIVSSKCTMLYICLWILNYKQGPLKILWKRESQFLSQIQHNFFKVFNIVWSLFHHFLSCWIFFALPRTASLTTTLRTIVNWKKRQKRREVDLWSYNIMANFRKKPIPWIRSFTCYISFKREAGFLF